MTSTLRVRHGWLPWIMPWLLSACAPKAGGPADNTNSRLVEPGEEPKWRTPSGRQEAWRDLAHWYVDNGLAQDALAMLDRLKSDGIEDVELDVIRARALGLQGLPSESERMLVTIVEAHPKDADAWKALGVAKVDTGDADGALRAFKRALDLDPDDAPVWNNYGFVLLSLRRCGEAVDALQRAVEGSSSDPRYRTNLSYALVCDGQPQRALDLLRSVLPEAEARYNLGVAYENLDKYPSAVLQYEQALDVDPDHQLATEALARVASHIPTPAEPGATP